MRAVLMIVADASREQPFQTAFIHGNYVIQQVPSGACHAALHDAVRTVTFEQGPHRPILRDRSAPGIPSPHFPSRSKMRNRGAGPNGNASYARTEGHSGID